MQGQNIVKINIPELEKVNKHIREAIHCEYKAQIIDSDIFIKVSFIPDYIYI
jgi:hypothetical protein